MGTQVMIINFELLKESFPALLRGAYVSVQIASISCLFGLCLGTVLALLQETKNIITRILIGTYVTIIRGTPMLIQISFWYFGFGLDPFVAAVLAIGLNSGAYVSEIIRSGISSVGKGQREAAQVLGLNTLQTIRFIILPQAFSVVIPALGNEFITIIKDSALASTIGVVELFRQANYIKGRTFDVFTPYFGMALIYLTLTTSLSLLVNIAERKFRRHAQS